MTDTGVFRPGHELLDVTVLMDRSTGLSCLENDPKNF